MTSLFEQAHIEVGEAGWLLQGPWVDAKQETTLDLAIEHCDTCCFSVLEPVICGDTDYSHYTPLKQDVQFLKTILSDLQYDDAKADWQQQIEHLITLAYIKEIA